MSDIYQQIWDADQAEAGVVPLLDSDNGDRHRGYVKVNSSLDANDPDLKVLPEAVIPDSKRRSYDLCRVLFDNYALRERDDELDTPEEREEVHDLVQHMVVTAPMEVAREYIERATGTSVTRQRWYNTVMEMWFRRFSMGGDPDLSGFEHVIVGEQERSKVQGYHFWYKFYLDDGFARQVDGVREHFPGLADDRIHYLGSEMGHGQHRFPESVTISYRWDAPDYDRSAMRPLTKPIGGFFVGCSVEGLLALGTVRAHAGARAPKVAHINGGRYDLALYHSDNRRHVRTFYPKFKGAAPDFDGDDGNGGSSPPAVSPSYLRIIAALINPEGHDPGDETVTLINTGTAVLDLSGWRIEDRNGRFQPLDGVAIQAGDTARVLLDPAGAQLSNKGGSIALIDSRDSIVHSVAYSKGQARDDGRTILF
jgi:hypothetical protein